MNYEFVYLPGFDRQVEALRLTDDDLQVVENELNGDPRKGEVIPDAGCVRKLRMALHGRGKRGGARAIYLYIEVRGRIYLIALYAKNVQENIRPEQKRDIRALVRMLEGEQ